MDAIFIIIRATGEEAELNMSSNAYVGITSSRFKNNYAYSGDGDGGAIYQESGTLIISSSTF